MRQDAPDIRILSARFPHEFIGRTAELEACANAGDGIVIESVPGAGTSEFLKQIFDRTFRFDAVLPFYFRFREDEDTAATARRFVHEFLITTIAFTRRDRNIFHSSPGVAEIAELALPADGNWIDRLADVYLRGEFDAADTVRTFLNAPLRAFAAGREVLVVLDDMHLSPEAAREICRQYEGSGIRFIFAARRRFENPADTSGRTPLGPLPFDEVLKMIEMFASVHNVVVNDSTRELIAAQFRGNARNIESLFAAARQKGIALDTFENVGKVYCGEMLSGSFSRRYDAAFRRAVRISGASRRDVLRFLNEVYEHAAGSMSLDDWRKRFAADIPNFDGLAASLNESEFLHIDFGRVFPLDDDVALNDHLRARFRVELDGGNLELYRAELIPHQLKRAPRIMANVYRGSAAIGLREILSAFRGQEIPAVLFDHDRFSEAAKGVSEDVARREIDSSSELRTLPKIVHTAFAESLYRPIARFVQKELAAVGIGFRDGRIDDEHEIVWLAAEVDSKMEASLELAEFWCDRLETMALMCGFVSYRIWLVAPEGFSPESLEMLKERGAIGTSRKQAEWLAEKIGVRSATTADNSVPDEYEITIPMTDDGELISAHAIEEIAKRYNFQPKAINQIKTALVEACINAAEHSRSPDRKIRQKVAVADGKMTITVSNRGLRLRDARAAAEPRNSERRGWGLRLMETLMDEVSIDDVDDGTSISMTKYLVHEGENA